MGAIHCGTPLQPCQVSHYRQDNATNTNQNTPHKSKGAHTMKFFENIRSLDALKKEYRRLAMLHHPDRGGDTATMQAINAEFEAVFPAVRLLDKSQRSTTEGKETATSYRREFYTQNGWKGERYNRNLTLKDIAKKVREYIKEYFPTYKFSVRTHYASMCQELTVTMMECPVKIYKDYEELTEQELNEVTKKMRYNHLWRLDSWTYEQRKMEILRIWEEKGGFYKVLTEQVQATAESIDTYVKSYNYSDCDGMIDYFDVNFYYFGCIDNNGENIKHVPRTPRIQARPKQSPEAEASKAGIRVQINPDFNGIEVYFSGKPSEDVRSGLKAHGWRWHTRKKCWYNRNTEDNLRGLKAITDGTEGNKVV